MKKRLAWLAALVMIWLPTIVMAQETKWVYDPENYLAGKTMGQVGELNEVTFKKLEGSPQLMVEMLAQLPKKQSMDQYKLKRFNQLGVGQADYDNGLLLVIAVEDREFGLEVGKGLEGEYPPESKDLIFDEKVIEALRDEDYDEAVSGAVGNIQEMMSVGGYQAYAKEKQKKDHLVTWLIAGGAVSIMVASFTGLRYSEHKLKKNLTRLAGGPCADDGFTIKIRDEGNLFNYSMRNWLARFYDKSKPEEQVQPVIRQRYLTGRLIEAVVANLEADNQLRGKSYQLDDQVDQVSFAQRGPEQLGGPLYLADFVDLERIQPAADKLTDEGEIPEAAAAYVAQVRASLPAEKIQGHHNREKVRVIIDKYLDKVHQVREMPTERREFTSALLVSRVMRGGRLGDPQLVDKLRLGEAHLKAELSKVLTEVHKLTDGELGVATDRIYDSFDNYYVYQFDYNERYYTGSSSSSSSYGSDSGGGSSDGGGFSGSW